MGLRKAPKDVRCCLGEAGVILSATPRALGELFRRERRRTGAPIVRMNGLRAVTNGRRRWIVFIGQVWLIDGRVVPWVRVAAAAARLKMTEFALRRALERNQWRTPEGWVSTYNGIPARKLGERWLLCFEQKRCATRSSGAGGAS